jgi:hypothetical protein
MSWRWNARRLLISAYVVFHLGATVIWILPPCALKQRTMAPASYYMVPLGLWQCWSMFAPDPVNDTIMLDADVIDAKGLRYTFSFPRLESYTLWQGVTRFRFSKFTANLASDEFELVRKYAARHVVRQLKLAPEAFPLDVHLVYQLRKTPPPGQPPVDPLTPTKPLVLASYQFATPQEAQP